MPRVFTDVQTVAVSVARETLGRVYLNSDTILLIEVIFWAQMGKFF